METSNTKEKYTGFKKKIADRLTAEYETDERLGGIYNQTLSNFGVFSVLYFIGRIFYVAFAHHKPAIAEIVMLALFFLLMWADEKENNIYSFPTFMGKKLNTGTDKKAKKSRVLLYLGESLIFGVVVVALDLATDIAKGGTPSVRELIVAIASFIVATAALFLFNYLTTERKIKKYNAYQKQLEEEENNLDD